MCLTPSAANVLMSCSGLSFSDGIIGSILTHTGMPFLVRVCMACSLCEVCGALGSSCFAKLSLSVIMVNATIEGVFSRTSVSLVTRFDLVMIWIRQLWFDRIWRHCRVSLRVFSIVG